jgi:hypothetical protein
MAEIGRHGRTVLFVSHDLGAVTRLCRRAIWLEHGRLRRDGPAAEVVSEYLAPGTEQPLAAEFPDDPGASAALTATAIRDGDGHVLVSPRRDEPFIVELRFTVRDRIPGLDVGVSLIDEAGMRVIYDARSDWSPAGGLPGEPGRYEARVMIPPLLRAGGYALEAWIGSENDTLVEREVLTLQVLPRYDDRQEWIDRPRVIQPRLEWHVRREPLLPS